MYGIMYPIRKTILADIVKNQTNVNLPGSDGGSKSAVSVYVQGILGPFVLLQIGAMLGFYVFSYRSLTYRTKVLASIMKKIDEYDPINDDGKWTLVRSYDMNDRCKSHF